MRPRHRLAKITYTSHDKERLSLAERSSPGEERTPFERDRSRIIHSAAFRRLQGKTQVFTTFTTGEGDFWRTRLTHSLEVAQIGKGLALRLRADTDLVEAVSLVHDIGHPPFGHAGEAELKCLMTPYGGFEANAQNVRIISKLESKSHKYHGLNLTRAVIDGQMKYKEKFAEGKDKFVYADDLGTVKWASREACATVDESNKGCESWKSFECEIMDWADKVAYAVHDLEDSIHTGYIDLYVFRDDGLINRTAEEIGGKFRNCDVDVSAVCRAFVNESILMKNPDLGLFAPLRQHRERKAGRKMLTSHLIGRYIKAAERVERGEMSKNAVSERYRYSLHVPVEYRVEVAFINRLISNVVFMSPQILILEEKAKYIVRRLFVAFMASGQSARLLPYDWQERLKCPRTEGRRARVVSDYISGMTDGYAQRVYSKLFLPNQGSVFDVL